MRAKGEGPQLWFDAAETDTRNYADGVLAFDECATPRGDENLAMVSGIIKNCGHLWLDADGCRAGRNMV